MNYDFEHDTFYKINPQTGKQQLAYVNGEPLKHFRPNVTGYDYHLRKVIYPSFRVQIIQNKRKLTSVLFKLKDIIIKDYPLLI